MLLLLPTILLLSVIACTVLIYNGPGTSSECIAKLHQRLSSSSPTHTVATADHLFLADPNNKWEESAVLLVVPGGRDLFYVEHLPRPVLSRIRRYVRSGGSFLGICAGAYFSAAHVEFEKGRRGYEVVGKRHLRLFRGKAVGAVFPGFEYADPRSIRATRLSPVAKTLRRKFAHVRLYYHGGCYFKGRDRRYRTLATYASARNRPAIIYGRVGKGRVVLSGVHIEYTAENSADLAIPCLGRLQKYQSENAQVWRYLLQKLNVATPAQAS